MFTSHPSKGTSMNKDDIVKLAIEHTVSGLKFDEDGLVRFAKLVAEHERNEIIEILDASTGYVHMDAIRERT